MVIIWSSGNGILVFLALILGTVLGSFLGKILMVGSVYSQWLYFASTLITMAPIWYWGVKWNSVEPKVLIDPETGEEFALDGKNQHIAFFVPMQYWAFIGPGIWLVVCISTFFRAV